jgi:Leucine-rich repeat (LRR) protein
MGIDTIPNEIGDLGALEHLDLSNNRLRSLPDSIIKIDIFYTYKLCQGQCGGSDCCWTESRN